MPTLAQSVPAESTRSGSDTSTLTAALTGVSVGDVVVVKLQTWDATIAAGTPSGGSQTYTSRAIIAPAGFASYGRIYTAVMAAGVASSFTVTIGAPAAGCYHNVLVERWTSAQLAGTPATNTASYVSASAPSSTITTVGTGSVVSFLIGDAQSIDPATDAYLSSAISEQLYDYHTAGDGVYRFARQTAAVAGSQTYGMSAPATQKWVMAAIEIQAAAAAAGGPVPFLSQYGSFH